jgi:hypothetical protein
MFAIEETPSSGLNLIPKIKEGVRTGFLKGRGRR